MATLTEKETRILMEPEGFWREHVTREFIGDQSTHVRSVASSLPASIIKLARLTPTDPFGVHLQLKSAHALLFTRLTELKLSTFFRFGPDKQTVHPCFAQIVPTDFKASFVWQVPHSMGLYFVMMLAPPGDARDYSPHDYRLYTHGHPIKFYLLAVAGAKAGGFWRLPLCNIYEDASICMGTYAGDNLEATAVDRLGLALTHFRNSNWNSHLADQQNPEDQVSLFSFTPQGHYIAPPEKWWTHCKKVNNTNYSDLPLINLYTAGL
jgi:hypothetical protein